MFSAAQRNKKSPKEFRQGILKILFTIPLLNLFVSQKSSLYTESIHSLIVGIYFLSEIVRDPVVSLKHLTRECDLRRRLKLTL